MVTGVRYPEFPVVWVPLGAEGVDMMSPDVVVLLLLMMDSDELDAKEVVNSPPKYIDEPFELDSIVLTAPLRPPNGIDFQAADDTSHSPRFPPDPVGAANSPPAQTSPFWLSHHSVSTGPDTPADSDAKVEDDKE